MPDSFILKLIVTALIISHTPGFPTANLLEPGIIFPQLFESLFCLVPIYPSDWASVNGRMSCMTNFAKNCPSTVIPGVRYRNTMAMIDWLCNAFGFEKKAVYSGADGLVMHAELTFGNGMIMLGSVDNQSPSSKMMAITEAWNCIARPERGRSRMLTSQPDSATTDNTTPLADEIRQQFRWPNGPGGTGGGGRGLTNCHDAIKRWWLGSTGKLD